MPINQLTDYEKSIDMDLKLDCNGNQIKNVADPTEEQDVATKKYVDDNAGGGSNPVTTTITTTMQRGVEYGSVDFETIYEDDNIALYVNKSSEAYTIQGIVKLAYYGTSTLAVVYVSSATGSAFIPQEGLFVNVTALTLEESPYTNRIAQMTSIQGIGRVTTHIFHKTELKDSYKITILKGDITDGLLTHIIEKYTPP